MKWLIGGIVLVIIFIIFDKFILKKNKEDTKINQNEKLPYHVKDNFLTDTESSFYHALKEIKPLYAPK